MFVLTEISGEITDWVPILTRFLRIVQTSVFPSGFGMSESYNSDNIAFALSSQKSLYALHYVTMPTFLHKFRWCYLINANTSNIVQSEKKGWFDWCRVKGLLYGSGVIILLVFSTLNLTLHGWNTLTRLFTPDNLVALLWAVFYKFRLLLLFAFLYRDALHYLHYFSLHPLQYKILMRRNWEDEWITEANAFTEIQHLLSARLFSLMVYAQYAYLREN